MGQIVLAAAGAVAGGIATGGSPAGIQAGWLAGAKIGGSKFVDTECVFRPIAESEAGAGLRKYGDIQLRKRREPPD